MNGKTIRLNRILVDNKMLCVPLDHGITNGPIANLMQFRSLTKDIISSGATSVICHKGMVRFLPDLEDTGLIIHLSASTDLVKEVNKNLVTTVEEALKLGADAVSVHVNIGNSYENLMLKDLSFVSSQCRNFGIPLMAMMYVRDDNNTNISTGSNLQHAVRIAAELGADIAKITIPDTIDELRNIVNNSLIPIVLAGGERYSSDADLLKKTRMLMDTGISGISYGRNVFESKSPSKTVSSLRKLIIG